MKKKKKITRIKKKYFIYLIIFIVIIFITLLVIKLRSKTPEVNHSGWMSGLEQVDYMNIHNFSSNLCKHEYYSPVFKVEDDMLYDYNNDLIKEGIFSILIFRYGDCEDELVFATGLNGKLYYINNIRNNKKKYKIYEVPNAMYTTEIGYDDENNIVATGYDGTEENITEFIESLM